jgi:CRP/FNR family transcriptional regulator, dissimilatory nitrate respiration regulator
MIDQRLLALVPALGALPAPAQKELARRGASVSFARGQFLFHAGDPPRGLFLIVDGRVRVVNERGGRRHLVHEETAGATLGEVPLLLGGGYPASAVAASKVECLLFSRDALHAAMALSADFSWFLLQRLAVRVRSLVQRLGQVSTTPVQRILASMILERSQGQRSITLAATQQELAESLGTVREVVARQLTALRRAGAISAAGRGRLVVVSRARLERIARGEPV